MNSIISSIKRFVRNIGLSPFFYRILNQLCTFYSIAYHDLFVKNSKLCIFPAEFSSDKVLIVLLQEIPDISKHSTAEKSIEMPYASPLCTDHTIILQSFRIKAVR